MKIYLLGLLIGLSSLGLQAKQLHKVVNLKKARRV
jgi:hypothetical protein